MLKMKAEDIDRKEQDKNPREEDIKIEVEKIKEKKTEEQKQTERASTEAGMIVQERMASHLEDQTVAMAQLPEYGAQNSLETVRQEQTALNRLSEQVSELVRRLGANGRSAAIAKYAAITAGVVTTIAAATGIYYNIMKIAENSTEVKSRLKSDIPDIPEAEEIFMAWKRKSDKDFWENIASNVESATPPYSYQDLLLFMEFTEDISKYLMQSTFTWENGDEKLTIVKSLADQIDKESFATTLRMLPQLTYKGKILPRTIAANLMSHAITFWYINYE
ncbi:hypothetical protein [Brevibacillus porteri]|uniref:Uncharacterized protein n=1 Tax=Brevibacillus porteri TaxID=2126350 RepID=A0ABX5FQW5_9BACL|nr:hypothetical protein [Brevibacillus porteri]MED1799647.1 hypothetical protein [Brevibacillus porteri]MED2133087.1 hypothetical protein [Brevibacillus porteri]MED2747411.1 hypothetical protein [Brevibacillus porteri]MED2813860.1 hypothetical protein [Brevibacillus porteri]MED2893049.1 hypothetical protein [Brevibacillus porteri]